MNDFQYTGRTMSIVVGFCVYILIWRYALNIYDANCDYYDGWKKVIKLFCCIWVYGHIVLVVFAFLIAWFVWNWM